MAKTKSRQWRFTQVHLENRRNFVVVDVPLQRRVFLVGPNASGKSNFLEAFRFLSDIVAAGWRPDVAAVSSDSLSRCLLRLRQMARGEP